MRKVNREILNGIWSKYPGGVEMKVVGNCRDGFALLVRSLSSTDEGDWDVVVHETGKPSYSHMAMIPMFRLLNAAERIQESLKEASIYAVIRRDVL